MSSLEDNMPYDQVGRPILRMDVIGDEEIPEVVDSEWDHQQKSLILKSAPFVVGITTYDVPEELFGYNSFGLRKAKHVFNGSGIIIECEAEATTTTTADGAKFPTIILTTSNLFTRTNGVQPSDIVFEVYPPDGQAYDGQVLCCDFHYNLVAIKILADAPLQVAKLRDFKDIFPFDTVNPLSSGRFQLGRHSDSFPICVGDLVAAIGRHPMGDIVATFGSFSVDYPKLDCKELYSLGVDHKDDRGGPVVNRHGEVIGILVVDKYFLPCNIVSRWWKVFSQYSKFCRPSFGFKFANLHRASVEFLEPFIAKFPTVSAGVIVTEVKENSPAYQSGIQARDVIVRCDSVPVRSTLELFETMWDKVGRCVELTILRLSSGDHINLNMTVNDATKDNFYRWPIPESAPELYCENEGLDSEEMFEEPHSGEMTDNME